MKLALFLIAVSCYPQAVAVLPPSSNPIELHVTFTPQGAKSLQDQTGKRIKGIEVIGIIVHSATAAQVQGSQIRAFGAGYGISFEDVPAQDAIVGMAAINSVPQVAVDASTDVPGFLTDLIATRVWRANPTWTFAIVAAQVAIGILKPRLAARIPDKAKFVAAETPTVVTIPAGGSADSHWLARYRGPQNPIRLLCKGWGCVPEK